MHLGKALRRSTGPALVRAGLAGPGCSGSSAGETDSLQGWRFHFSLHSPPLYLTALNFSFYFSSELFQISDTQTCLPGLWPFHCVTRSHRSFPTGLFSICFPAHSLEQLFHPNCWAAHLPLSKFMTFLSARFSIISRSFQKAACLATRAALGLQIVSVVSVFTQLIHTDAKLFSPLCFNHSISLSEITILFYFPVEQKS